MAPAKARWLTIALQLGLAGALAAQSPSITGRLFIAGDSIRPVVDAEVTLLPSLRVVRSDSSGAFRFSSVSPGLYTLRVRRVGFEVVMQDVSVDSASSGGALNIAMRSGARVLAEVVISGARVLFPARLAEPYSRVARGRGAFFTRELIDSLQPWDTYTLLTRVPGVRVNDRSIRIARCENHGASGGAGNLHVFIDGIRQTKYGGDFARGASEVLRDVVITSVQLIEVYTSINAIPPEFADDACAVILVWSR
jgi:hypothetical protein